MINYNNLFKKLLWFTLMFTIFIAITPFALWLNPNIPTVLLPSPYIACLWAFPLMVFVSLNNIYNKAFCLVWLLWFLIGTLNIIASYYKYGHYYLLNVQTATFIYIVFTFFFFVGIFLIEKRHPSPDAPIDKNGHPESKAIHPLFLGFLLIFPLLWLGSLFKSLGYIPILRGVDLTEELYELNYGPLYGLGLLNVLALLILFDKINNTSSFFKKIIFQLLLALYAFISIVDGKRYSILIFIIISFVYLVKVKGTKAFNKILFRFSILVIVAYWGTLILREGTDFTKYQGWEKQFSIVGVEYRDFVFSVNKFEPGKIKNYDFTSSTLVAPLNSGLLSFWGFDKLKIIATSGSAHAFKVLFNSPYGIRTGIVSELYFAYNFWGVIVIFAIGLLLGYLNNKIDSTSSNIQMLFLPVIYSLLLLSIVGQTTATMGQLSILFYCWVIYLIILKLIPLKSKWHNKMNNYKITSEKN